MLDVAVQKTAARGQRLIWYTPTQYCRFDPTQANLGVKGCTAALYSMCVEPDGAVIPCQSYYQPLGHLLTDPWDSIWNHELSTRSHASGATCLKSAAGVHLCLSAGAAALCNSPPKPLPPRTLETEFILNWEPICPNMSG